VQHTTSKYTVSMGILQAVKHGNHPNNQNKNLLNTLIDKGYLTRNNGIPNTQLSLTEKGAKTLQEYNEMKKIIEKTREGTHPSMDHRDR
jgi:predicted transcriptional regulator